MRSIIFAKKTEIHNILGEGKLICVNVKTNTFSIPAQVYDDDNDISGRGVIHNDTMTLTLQNLTSDIFDEVCTVEALRH